MNVFYHIYDANGNLLTGGGRSYIWTVDNLPLSVSQTSGSESYTYDADGERIKKVAGSTTTVYLEGLWEEDSSGTQKAYYAFNGQTAVMYSYSPSAFTYLSNDHLGSVSVATNQAAAVAGQQEFDRGVRSAAAACVRKSQSYSVVSGAPSKRSATRMLRGKVGERSSLSGATRATCA
jgi:hypothetical protein